jgi:hypothetical protein
MTSKSASPIGSGRNCRVNDSEAVDVMQGLLQELPAAVS